MISSQSVTDATGLVPVRVGSKLRGRVVWHSMGSPTRTACGRYEGDHLFRRMPESVNYSFQLPSDGNTCKVCLRARP